MNYNYDAAWKQLTSRGFKLNGRAEWVVPRNLVATPEDLRAVEFLRYVWDFGGLAEEPAESKA